MDQMKLSRDYNAVFQFLSAFSWAGGEGVYDDRKIVNGRWVAGFYSPETFPSFQREAQAVLSLDPFPWNSISNDANRHFKTEQDCRIWFEKIVSMIEARFAGDGPQKQATRLQ